MCHILGGNPVSCVWQLFACCVNVWCVINRPLSWRFVGGWNLPVCPPRSVNKYDGLCSHPGNDQMISCHWLLTQGTDVPVPTISSLQTRDSLKQYTWWFCRPVDSQCINKYLTELESPISLNFLLFWNVLTLCLSLFLSPSLLLNCGKTGSVKC